jgi:hypothetical protein
MPLLPDWAFYPRSGALDALAALGNEARFFAMVPGDMPAEVPVAYGLNDVRGYDALHPRRTAMLLRRAVDHPPWTSSLEALPTVPDIKLPLLGLMAVRCIANWADAPGDLARLPFRGEAKLPTWAPFQLVRNPHFLPRARLVAGRVVEPDDERALDALSAADFPLETTVILADGAPAPVPAPSFAGRAQISEDRADSVRVDVEPRQPCTLVLADSFHPGWRAFVDGVERPIQRANVAFRGVALVPGEHTVEFRYEPLSFRLGAWASAAAAAILLLLSIRAARRPPAGPPRAA